MDWDSFKRATYYIFQHNSRHEHDTRNIYEILFTKKRSKRLEYYLK